MSLDHRLYLGPYVYCGNPTIETTRFIRTCLKKTCMQHGHYLRTTFCGDCGGQVEMTVTPCKASTVHAGDVAVDRSTKRIRYFSFGEHDTWFPNETWAGSEDWDLTLTGEREVAVGVPAREKAAFVTAFQHEIAFLRSIYGETAVEARWGLLGKYE